MTGQSVGHPAEKSIDGIHYKISGDGPRTVVLLRGLGRWSEHWLGVENLLAAEGLRVISIDNRGFGKSKDVLLAKDQNVDQFADDVSAVITKEAPSGAHIIGVSLGGMIAISLAALKPQLVKSLVIINSSVAGSKCSRLKPKAVLALAAVAIGSKKAYDRLAGVLLGATSSADKKTKLASSWSAIDARSKFTLGPVWSQLLAAKRFQGFSEMAAIQCPVTVIKSEGDLFIDPANSDFIHKQIKGSTLIKHPTAGHELAFDDTEWFVKAVTDQVSGRTSAK